MEFKISQPNMLENNDCMVQALANALDKPYFEVHSQLKRMGRRNRCGTPWPICVKAMLMYNISMASPLHRRVTHAQFVAQNPKGRFVLMSRSHAWAVKDGVAYGGWRVGPRKQIRCIGRVS